MEIPCPHCGSLINPASLLGEAGKGVPRELTEEEKVKRRERLRLARHVRGIFGADWEHAWRQGVRTQEGGKPL
jgi:sarcosine oxidase delta subunit